MSALLEAPTQRDDDGQWHRLSARMLLIHPITELGKALPALIGIFLAGSAQGNHVWGLAATGVVVLLSLTRWFTTRLRITADTVQLRHGLLRRKTITTKRERIRTVDLTSHVLHRALGLVRMVIGTGINDRKGEGRLILDGLPAPAAHALRDELLDRREPSATTAVPDAGRELVRLDRRWIRFAPFTLSGVITGAIIWGFYWRIQGESGVDLARSGPLRAVSDALRAMPTAAAVLVVAAVLLAFIAVTSTVGYVLAFWNFRLRRHEDGTLRVTRGLLTTRATSIERRRLHGVGISEPIVLRAVGAARTVAIATGLQIGRGSERGGEVLLPPAPRAEAVGVAEVVLDGTPAITARLRPHPSAARRRRLIRAVGAALVVLAAGLIAWARGEPMWVPAVAAVPLVLAVPIAFDRYANLGHALTDGYLVTRTGSLVRRQATLETTAIIGWNLRATLFQRRLGLATLCATTAAGRQGYRVTDIAHDEAVAIARTITPELLDQFRRAPATTIR